MKNNQRKKALLTTEPQTTIKTKKTENTQKEFKNINIENIKTFYVRKNHTWISSEKPKDLKNYIVENYIPNAEIIFARKTV